MDKPFQLGSISIGTLKTHELLPAFLPHINPESDDAKEAQAVLERIANNDWPQNINNWEEYQVEFDTADLLQSIIDQIECPPFVYFGAQEGDITDFGFWVDHADVLELMLSATENEEGDAFITDDGLLAHDGHDITYMDMERNVIWSTV
jgi:hypothetical protein